MGIINIFERRRYKFKAVMIALAVFLAASVGSVGGSVVPAAAQDGYHLCEGEGPEGQAILKMRTEHVCSDHSIRYFEDGEENLIVLDEIDGGSSSDCAAYSSKYLATSENICEYMHQSYRAYYPDDLWEDVHYPEGEVQDDTVLCVHSDPNLTRDVALMSKELYDAQGCKGLLNSYQVSISLYVESFSYLGSCSMASQRTVLSNNCVSGKRVITTKDWDEAEDGVDCLSKSNVDFDGLFVKTYCLNP